MNTPLKSSSIHSFTNKIKDFLNLKIQKNKDSLQN
jgi:hypothetical protein